MSKYRILNDVEHVLLRPDIYVGEKDVKIEDVYVYNENKIELKTLTYSPLLLKLFDEGIVNAFDHYIRCKKNPVTYINVTVTNSSISILNDGDPIPTNIIKTDKGEFPVSEMIFGHLRSGENFNDGEGRITGGKNGYGVKLCNIFSTKFSLDIKNANEKTTYKQVWKDHMRSGNGTGKIKKDYTGGKNEVKITFYPDFEYMELKNGIDDEMISLLHRRTMDIASCAPDIVIKFNGKKVINSLVKYGRLLDLPLYKIHSDSSPHFEVYIGVSTDKSDISLVNGINTMNGGTHVNWVKRKVYDLFKTKLKKNEDPPSITIFSNKIFVLMRIACKDPSFDAQTKTKLTTARSKWGFEYNLDDKAMNKFILAEKLKDLFRNGEKKLNDMMKKSDGEKVKRVVIDKYQDAFHAGGSKSMKCTLILTEGVSASSMFRKNIPKELQPFYGSYALRGKLLNTRKAADNKIVINREIQDLKKILGLKNNVKYDKQMIKSLRYGKVLIATDADVDGTHIRALVINFFDTFWPELLDLGFIECFYTPIIIYNRGKGKKEELVECFTEHEMNEWKKNNDWSNWNGKYYKGLGSNTNKDARRYMNNLPFYVKPYRINNSKKDHLLIELAHNKESDWRKKEILNYKPNMVIPSIKEREIVGYGEFIEKEYSHFQIYTIKRAIAHLMDGFKVSQRKVLHTMMKKNLYGEKKEKKVFQLCSIVSEDTYYHHGDASLNGTISSMAASFTGSNNISLLFPSGQFGSRVDSEAASPRYTLSYLRDYVKILFPQEPSSILHPQYDDGVEIEPLYLAPIIPMILVNGTSGIANGFSSNIPPFNIRDIVTSLIYKISGNIEAFDNYILSPWWRGFTGTIEPLEEDGKWLVSVPYTSNMKNEYTMTITLSDILPMETVSSYERAYNKLIHDGLISDYNTTTSEINPDECVDDGYDTKISIVINIPNTSPLFSSESNRISKLKLETTVSTTNMHLISPTTDTLYKYNNAREIINEFYNERLNIYMDRRKYLIDKLKLDISVYENKIRFIKEVNDGDIIILKRKRQIIEDELDERKYDRYPDYNYLLNIRYIDITADKIENLESSLRSAKEQLDELNNSTPANIWIGEIKKLVPILDSMKLL